MRTFHYLLAVLLLSVLQESCCTKKDCMSSAPGVYVYGFSQDEMDSVMVYRYAADNSFKTPLDSVLTHGVVIDTDTHMIYDVGPVNSAYNFKIKILETGSLYFISDFIMARRGCNSCFPYRPASDYYEVMTEYKLNGNLKSGSTIEIEK